MMLVLRGGVFWLSATREEHNRLQANNRAAHHIFRQPQTVHLSALG